jgi:hypothetical protein
MEISDDDIIHLFLTCPDCGGQRLQFDRAVELARRVNSLQEWFERLDDLEDKLSAPAPRALPSADAVRSHCEALAKAAAARK